MLEWLAQGIGILGMALAILSFQCKNNKIFFLMQGFSGASFSVHFFLLGNPTAALMNLINLLRGYAFGYTKGKKRVFFTVVTLLLYVLATVFTYRNWISVMLLAVQLAQTTVMWTDNAPSIRHLQLFVSSPAWMFQNALTRSIGGVLCECFNIISVLVAFFRFGFRGKKEAAVPQPKKDIAE